MSGVVPGGTGNITAVYTIDGKSNDAYIRTQPSVPVLENGQIFTGQVFFRASNLANTSHTILINVTNTGNGRNFTLDFFTIQSVGNSVGQFAPSSGSHSGLGLTLGDTIGAAIGSAMFVLLVVGLALSYNFWKRRHKAGESTVRQVQIIVPFRLQSRKTPQVPLIC